MFEALCSVPYHYFTIFVNCVESCYVNISFSVFQLGLPMYCVRPVPCNTLFGSQQKIDVAALERLIEEDKASNRVPLIVLADAGKINIIIKDYMS
jgi:hypothetical protein